MISKIRRVPLRKVWAHEAHDFSPWLQNNIDVLNDALGLDLTNVEREQSVGTFNVDLTAEDGAGELVVIENQLERSDHDHLGKVITYASHLNAKTAVWIVSDPREEHKHAIAWLNESSAINFYLIQVEAVSIGESDPAPLLTLITGPSVEAAQAGRKKEELSERHVLRREFWMQLLEKASKITKLHSSISAGKNSYLGASGGLPPGLSLNYVIRTNDCKVELYIDQDKDDGAGNVDIFERLQANKDEIERTFGDPLDWQPLENRRACRVEYVSKLGGLRSRELWPDIQDEMIDRMVKLEAALKPELTTIGTGH